MSFCVRLAEKLHLIKPRAEPKPPAPDPDPELQRLKGELRATMHRQERAMGTTEANTERAKDALRMIRAVLDRVNEGREQDE